MAQQDLVEVLVDAGQATEDLEDRPRHGGREVGAEVGGDLRHRHGREDVQVLHHVQRALRATHREDRGVAWPRELEEGGPVLSVGERDSVESSSEGHFLRRRFKSKVDLKTCGPTGEGTKARAKEGSIVSARISSYLIDLNLHPFGAVHGRSCV